MLRPIAALLLLLLLFPEAYKAEPPESDRASLLAFLDSVSHVRRLRWDRAASACNWTGVRCDASSSVVTGLHLPGTGLRGTLDRLPLLPSLRTLSFRSNRLNGTVPDLSNLTSLRGLYLQGNLLSGPIPPLSSSLIRLDLSSNSFTGQIPFSLNNLRRLTLLDLHSNSLSGPIPTLDLPKLTSFNVSANRLNGSIPRTLENFPASAFSGNLELCGRPLPPCRSFFLPPSPSPEGPPPGDFTSNRRRRISTAAIVGIAVGAGIFLILLLLALWFLARRRQGSRGSAAAPSTSAAKQLASNAGVAGSAVAAAETGTSSTSKDEMLGGAGERSKLVFLGNGGYSFDLEDLLRASAEVLGKGSMGTAYKAVLEDTTTVVVKRLKDVAVERKGFEVQMELLGKVKSHVNVVPLRAYYYSKDEKLLVYDYLTSGSLSALLHGGRGSGRAPTDWDNRLRIALAAGRGLVHLHLSAGLAHGNIKASNVLLRPDPDSAAFSDYGLNSLFAQTAPAPNNRAVGYRAPEFMETRSPTFKSDVYSFGVLLLELLTGKAPNQPSLGEEGIDLPRWVQSVVREEWTAEVFDVELMRYGEGNMEEEMVQLLQIAMSCVALLPDARPQMAEVVRMMEEIARRREGDDWRGVSSDDPGKATTPNRPAGPAGTTP